MQSERGRSLEQELDDMSQLEQEQGKNLQKEVQTECKDNRLEVPLAIFPDRDTTQSHEQMQEEVKEANDAEHPWEAQVGWIYAGHGEWVQRDPEEKVQEHTSTPQQEPGWICKWWSKIDKDIGLSVRVQEKGYPQQVGGANPSQVKMELGKI